MSDDTRHAEAGGAAPDPSALRLRAGLRIELLDDEALALDPTEGVVHRLEGTAAAIVADLRAGRTPDLSDEQADLVVEALIRARIVDHSGR